ncbi:MAG: leucine-rich repeat protein, partial [Synergistaceae bacterium]|nr:leucine-rich repeat protein [Synergistaceae bacterium]
MFLGAPFAWAANSWNGSDMVIDNFSTGSLGAKITAELSGDPPADITSLTLRGAAMGDVDFAFIRDNLSSIVTIDMSDVPITTLPSSAFSNNLIYADGNLDNLQNVTLPAGLTSIGDGAFFLCQSLALTNLPDGVTSIGDDAFIYCQNLALTNLPSGLISLGAFAFQGCTNLALTSLPPGLTSIGSSAFSFCTSLALTSLPSGLTSIEDHAFNGCTNLALTNLPAGLTSIEYLAFYECTNLEWLDLSSCNGLTSIDFYAFQNCSSLSVVAMPPVLPATIHADAFSGTAPVFLVPDTLAYSSWIPPAGTKVYITDGTLAPTGTASIPYGGTISFSCGNIAGASYQWEKETSPGVWTPISGATSRTYVKNGALTSDSGVYRCVITVSSTSLFKNPITLTVGPAYTVAFDSQGGSAV